MAQGDFLASLFGLQEQVAVVIGGTGVLCGAQARGLAAAGASVVVAGRDPGKGEAVVKEIQCAGGSASFAAVDVTSRDSITALRDTVLERHGSVDMLINGAGVNFASAYLDLPDEDWKRVMASNVDGVHMGCQVFGEQMVQQAEGGAILNLGSVSAHTPLSRVIAYSASKAAVLNLTQNLAREFAPHKVRVNALCPGFFPAEQNRKILDPDRIQSIMNRTPMDRFGEPEELIGVTLLLLSRAAGSFITGASYYVDGGFTSTSI